MVAREGARKTARNNANKQLTVSALRPLWSYSSPASKPESRHSFDGKPAAVVGFGPLPAGELPPCFTDCVIQFEMPITPHTGETGAEATIFIW